MALSIKTTEADGLARALAAATNETLTHTVTVALRERLDRVREAQRVDIAAQLDRLRVEYSALLVHDPRGSDEILGYDESGLPT